METLAEQVTPSGLHVALEEGVARVEIDLPEEKVNKLTSAWMSAFEALLLRLSADEAVRAVVLVSRKPDTFIAGADIDEIEALPSIDEARQKSRFGQRVFQRDISTRRSFAARASACHCPCRTTRRRLDHPSGHLCPHPL